MKSSFRFPKHDIERVAKKDPELLAALRLVDDGDRRLTPQEALQLPEGMQERFLDALEHDVDRRFTRRWSVLTTLAGVGGGITGALQRFLGGNLAQDLLHPLAWVRDSLVVGLFATGGAVGISIVAGMIALTSTQKNIDGGRDHLG